MMGLFLTVAVLLIGCFLCIVNMHYRKIECKNYSTWKKNNAFNSPKAWGLYASCIAIILGGIFIVSIRNVVLGFSSIGKQQDAITQQQQDIATQQQQDATTQEQDNSTQK
jgi:hypothetical protein